LGDPIARHQDHGCDRIPVTRAMSGALQRTDPRCKNQQPVSAEDAQALKDLGEVFKALKASRKPTNSKSSQGGGVHVNTSPILETLMASIFVRAVRFE